MDIIQPHPRHSSTPTKVIRPRSSPASAGSPPFAFAAHTPRLHRRTSDPCAAPPPFDLLTPPPPRWRSATPSRIPSPHSATPSPPLSHSVSASILRHFAASLIQVSRSFGARFCRRCHLKQFVQQRNSSGIRSCGVILVGVFRKSEIYEVADIKGPVRRSP